MDISLSKITKNYSLQLNSQTQCRLLRFIDVQQTVFYRRQPASKKRTKSQFYGNKKFGIEITSRKQQQLTKQSSIKSNQIQHSHKMTNNRILKINGHAKENLKKEQSYYDNKKLFINKQRQKLYQMYHGSWGIPKYPKPSIPLTQIKRFAPIKQQNNRRQILLNLKQITQYKLLNYQINNSTKIIFNQRIPIRKKSYHTQQKYQKNSKILNSTLISNGQQQIWCSIVQQPLKSFVSQTYPVSHNFNQIKSQSYTAVKMNCDNQNSNPIQKLSQARQARSVASSEFSRLHTVQYNSLKFEQHTSLKQSIVLANDINQQGFWN